MNFEIAIFVALVMFFLSDLLEQVLEPWEEEGQFPVLTAWEYFCFAFYITAIILNIHHFAGEI